MFSASLLPDLALLLSDQPEISGLTVSALFAMHLAVSATAVLTYQRVLPPPHRITATTAQQLDRG